MKLSKLLPLAIFATLCFLDAFSTARAAVVPLGNVIPAIPPNWTDTTTGYVGYNSGGTLTVDSASHLLSQDGYIGFLSGSKGLVTVSGSGSKWTNGGDLIVGSEGKGTLNMTDGGDDPDAADDAAEGSGSLKKPPKGSPPTLAAAPAP